MIEATTRSLTESSAASDATGAGSTGRSWMLAWLAFLPVVVLRAGTLAEADTFWQIRTGEWILDHHSIPRTDPFSFTAAGRHWFPHEWLAEVLLAL